MSKIESKIGKITLLSIVLGFLLGILVATICIVPPLNQEVDQYHRTWVAEAAVATKIANIPPNLNPRIDQVYLDERGCLVRSIMLSPEGQESISREYVVCKGGKGEFFESFKGAQEVDWTKEKELENWSKLGKPESGR